MTNIFEELAAIEARIKEVNNAYEQARKHYEEPTPWVALLPLGYRYLSRFEDTIFDRFFLSAIGQYLSMKFPNFREYYATTQQKSDARFLHDLIDQR